MQFTKIFRCFFRCHFFYLFRIWIHHLNWDNFFRIFAPKSKWRMEIGKKLFIKFKKNGFEMKFANVFPWRTWIVPLWWLQLSGKLAICIVVSTIRSTNASRDYICILHKLRFYYALCIECNIIIGEMVWHCSRISMYHMHHLHVSNMHLISFVSGW